jgi:hypothetical protein
LIHGSPNGATHLTVHYDCREAVHNGLKQVLYPEYIGVKEQTWGTETSKYPEERKSIDTPLVVASERGSAER